MTTTGLIAVAVVLVLGSAVGLWRRRADGRLRPVPAASFAAAGVEPAGDLRAGEPKPALHQAAADELSTTVEPSPTESDLAEARALAGGSSPAVDEQPGPDGTSSASARVADTGDRIDPGLLAALGVAPADATLLQFSSAFCAPCRALRRVASEVAAMVPGVQHVEVDAESHLDAVRALNIWRTPTLLVLDGDGRTIRRATGVPGKPQLIAVLGEILDGESAPGRR